jgi:hypothetical protein
MEWLVMLVAGFVLVVIAAPIALLLLTFFVLVPLAHLMPPPTTLARASFQCPFRKTAVTATFLTPPDGGGPADVVACSAFGDREVTCAKGCRALASVGWAPSPMVARFALIADEVALR